MESKLWMWFKLQISHSLETSYQRTQTLHGILLRELFSSLSGKPSQSESSDDVESTDKDSDMDSDKIMTSDEDKISDMPENLGLGQTSDTRVSPSLVGNIKNDETDSSEENPNQPGPSKKPRNS